MPDHNTTLNALEAMMIVMQCDLDAAGIDPCKDITCDVDRMIARTAILGQRIARLRNPQPEPEFDPIESEVDAALTAFREAQTDE